MLSDGSSVKERKVVDSGVRGNLICVSPVLQLAVSIRVVILDRYQTLIQTFSPITRSLEGGAVYQLGFYRERW